MRRHGLAHRHDLRQFVGIEQSLTIVLRCKLGVCRLAFLRAPVEIGFLNVARSKLFLL